MLNDPDSQNPSTGTSSGAHSRATTNLVTLVFTDVVGSTSLKQSLGDRAAAAILEEHDRLIRSALAEFPRGQEIGTAGDSFFCAFTTPSEAVKWALVVQARLRAFNASRESKIHDRIGIHLGEVVVKDPTARLQSKDLYGLSLDTCARIMSLADGGRILMSKPVFDSARSMLHREAIPGLSAIQWRNHGKYQFKGIEEPMEVCEVAETNASDFQPPASQEKAIRIDEPGSVAEFPWPPPPGTKLADRYIVGELIGAGGMGAVCRGQDINLERAVALKFIPAEMAGSRERVERFKREAKALASLNHPNVITVYSVEETRGRHFISMELVEGRSLSKLIPTGGMPVDSFLPIAIPLAEALRAAHSHGIIHRDLKPSNVMITGQNHVKVIDFGLAKVLPNPVVTDPGSQLIPSFTGELDLLGTPAYMSPEQAQGLPLDERSDIFSLGIIFYEMLAARRPFQGDSSASIVTAVLRDTPQSLKTLRPDLPEDLVSLVERCLQKDLPRRFESVDLVLEKLKALHASRTPTTTCVPLPTGTPAPQQSLWKIAAAFAALLVIVLLFIKMRPGNPITENVQAKTAAPASAPRFLPPQPVIVTSDTEEWPAPSPDGKKLAFVRRVDGHLHVFVSEIANTSAAEQITRDNKDHIQLAWSADGKFLAFAAAASTNDVIRPSDVWGGYYHPTYSDIWLHDFAKNQSALLVESAANPKFDHANRLTFCKAFQGLVSRIWTSDIRGRQQKPITDDPDSVDHYEPSWSPDGKNIVFRRQAGKYTAKLAIVNLETRKIHDLTENLFLSDPVWSPNGANIYFTANLSSGFNIWRLALDKDNRRVGDYQPMTFGTGRDLQPALSPDGKTLFYCILSWNSDIWAVPMDAAAGKPSGPPFELIASPREDTRADWSPDSTKLAFTSDRNGDMNLFIADFDPATRKVSNPRQVTFGPGGDYQPTWSADQKRIAFFSRRTGIEQVWRLDLNDQFAPAGPLAQLTKESKNINPTFSPDGAHIAFHSERNGQSEPWVMDADGSNQRALSSKPSGGHYIRWLDPNTVLFSSRDGILAVALDGTEPRKINSTGGAHLTFSPDHRYVADNDHTAIQASPIDSGKREVIFQFPDTNIGVDYTVWSPSGQYLLFDRNNPTGGDIYRLQGLE